MIRANLVEESCHFLSSTQPLTLASNVMSWLLLICAGVPTFTPDLLFALVRLFSGNELS